MITTLKNVEDAEKAFNENKSRFYGDTHTHIIDLINKGNNVTVWLNAYGYFSYGTYERNERTETMLEQYATKGWTQSNVNSDDSQFLAELDNDPSITSFTGNDIVYYDPIRVCVDNGSIVAVGS